MNKQIVKTGLIALAVLFFSVDANAQKKKKKGKKGKTEEVTTVKIELKNEVDTVSYAIGLNMTTSIKKDFSEVNFDLFIAGIRAGMEDNDSLALIKIAQIQTIVGPQFQKKQAAKQAVELKKSSN